MIKPMVVDLMSLAKFEVDATLGDVFYYYCFFYSQKELVVLQVIFTIFLKKAINGCGI